MRIFLLTSALALVFPAQLLAVVNVEWTLIGNPGNPADSLVMNDGTSGYGSVGYAYKIGKYEVTNNQYTEFLNAKDPSGTNSFGLYNQSMMVVNFTAGNPNGSKYSAPSGMGNWPMTGASWYNAIRFANWLNNGQDNSSTETGSYTLGPLGANGVPMSGSSIIRNSGAQTFLASENEWYKAAFYNPATGTYFRYATSSITAPVAESPPGGANSANWNFAVGHPTDVEAYSLAHSPYGTFDQSGNAYEWNEALIQGLRGLRGGSYSSFPQAIPNDQYAGYRNVYFANENVGNVGFRVASVPEPRTEVLAGMGLIAICISYIYCAYGSKSRQGAPRK